MQGFRGIKNKTENEVVLVHDAEPYKFAAGEIRILTDVIAGHALKFRSYVTVTDKGQTYVGYKVPFEEIPLAEALKVAKLDENPTIKQAQAEADRAAKERAKMRSEILAELRADMAKEAEEDPKAKAKKWKVPA